MKRYLSLFLVLMLALAMFAGCAPESASKEEAKKEAQQAADATPPPTAPPDVTPAVTPAEEPGKDGNAKPIVIVADCESPSVGKTPAQLSRKVTVNGKEVPILKYWYTEGGIDWIGKDDRFIYDGYSLQLLIDMVDCHLSEEQRNEFSKYVSFQKTGEDAVSNGNDGIFYCDPIIGLEDSDTHLWFEIWFDAPEVDYPLVITADCEAPAAGKTPAQTKRSVTLNGKELPILNWRYYGGQAGETVGENEPFDHGSYDLELLVDLVEYPLTGDQRLSIYDYVTLVPADAEEDFIPYDTENGYPFYCDPLIGFDDGATYLWFCISFGRDEMLNADISCPGYEDGGKIAAVGMKLPFTVTVTNLTEEKLTEVKVFTALSNEVKYVDLEPGGTAACTFSYKVSDADGAAGSIENSGRAEFEGTHSESESITVATHKHQFGKTTVTKSPTCTEPGTSVKTCKICGLKFKNEIKPLGHNVDRWVPMKTVGSTMSEELMGRCLRCGKTVTKKK